MFDGFAGAAIGGVTGLVGGLIGNRQQAKNLGASLDYASRQFENAAKLRREEGYAQLGLNIFNPVYASTTASDLDYFRQRGAMNEQLARIKPKELGLGREQARSQAAFENSADVKEARRRERLGGLQATIAGYRAAPTGMFGRIAQAPIESLMV